MKKNRPRTTDELIVQIASSARPVTPLRSPAIRLVEWTAWAAVTAGIALWVMGWRADFASAIASPAFAGSLALLILTSVGAAASAFALSVPGAERTWIQRALPVVAAIAWPVVWFAVAVQAAGTGAARPVRAVHTACALEIFGIAVVCGALLIVMIRRAAPLRPWWTATVVSLASIGAASAATQVICPLSDPVHQLVGHVLVAAVVATLGTVVGGWAFRLPLRPSL